MVQRAVPTSSYKYYTYIGTPTKESNWEAPRNSSSATQILPAGPYENAPMTEPSDETVSSLDVVCRVCLDELSIPNCIRSTGFCMEPSHEKVYWAYILYTFLSLHVPLISNNNYWLFKKLGSAGVMVAPKGVHVCVRGEGSII